MRGAGRRDGGHAGRAVSQSVEEGGKRRHGVVPAELSRVQEPSGGRLRCEPRDETTHSIHFPGVSRASVLIFLDICTSIVVTFTDWDVVNSDPDL